MPQRSWLRSPVLLAAAALALNALSWLFAPLLLLPLGVLACWAKPRALLHIPLGALMALVLLWPVLTEPRTLVPLGTPFPALSTLTLPTLPAYGPPGPGLIVAYSVDAVHPLQPVDGPALPWPWLVAAAAGAFMAWRASPSQTGVVAALAACILIWQVIALGPYLRWEGVVRDVALPYQALYEYVPFFSRLHWPARTLPFLWTAVVLLAVPVLAHLTRRGRGVTFMLAVAAVLPAAAQGLWPLPATPLRVPAFYKSAVQGGVIEASLPWNANVAGALQAWHGQKVLGNLAHHPPYFGDADPRLRDPRHYGDNAFLRALEQARSGVIDFDGAAAALPDLRAAGYRWVTLHRTLPQAATVERVLHAVLQRPPDVDEGGFAAWDLSRLGAAGNGR